LKNEPLLPQLSRETMEGLPGPIYMPWQSRLRRGFMPRPAWERRRLAGESAPAFTLIELLVVIAIIAILAALSATVMTRATVSAAKSIAVAERAEMASAIQEYHDRLGFYPPDNPSNPAINPLWFELSGTTNNGVNYVTLDGSGQISMTAINATFNRQGFANSGAKAHSTDESGAPISFLSNLRAKQVGPPDSGQPFIKILSCSAGAAPGATLNPWRYVSSHPTNNTGSYDLWVDLVVGGRTYQVNNWSKP
jgi:prepilin-type N-terminal cleavage/methylation domain-containing protein